MALFIQGKHLNGASTFGQKNTKVEESFANDVSTHPFAQEKKSKFKRQHLGLGRASTEGLFEPK